MNIGTLVDITGVLGFVLSIGVFVLTRWERKRNLVLQLESADYSRFSDELGVLNDDDSSVVILRVTNMGGTPIVVNKDTLIIKGNGRNVRVYKTDWLGMNDIPYPLNPASSFEVGVFKTAFEDILGKEEFSTYMNTKDWEKCVIPISAEVSDIKKRKYKSKLPYKYNFYVSEIEN
jgi:hypothetical protein